MSAGERRAWARRVHGQLQAQGLLHPGVTFVWLAGADYQRDLRALLSTFRHEDPLAGLNFGQRLQWLRRRTDGGRP